MGKLLLGFLLSCTPSKRKCRTVLDTLLCCQDGEVLVVQSTDSGMEYYGCVREGK